MTPADRFTRLEKLAIFLIALGEERTREILADVDVDTLQHLNEAIAGLGSVSSEEKAAVMLEFAHFFYADEPLTGKGDPPREPDQSPKAGGRTRVTPGREAPRAPPRAAGGAEASGTGSAERADDRRRPSGKRRRGKASPSSKAPASASASSRDLGDLTVSGASPELTDEEQAILQTLDKLRRKVDPGKIDWGRAGYDFGEGFKGPEGPRR